MTKEQTQQDDPQAIWDELTAEKEGTPTADTPPDNPPPTAAQGEPTEPAPEPAPPSEPAPPPDPQEQMIRDLMQKLERLEGRQRNVEGHIGGLKHSQQQMLDMLSAAKTAAAQTADAPTPSQVNKAIANPEKWESLKQDFPEWAEATEQLLQARLSALQAPPAFDPAQLEQFVAERIRGQTEMVRQEIIENSLEAVFPGWKDEVKTESFGKWLDSQPQDIRDLANSPRVGDAAKMLRLYEAAKQADPSERINQERKQKLTAAAATPRGVRVPPAKSADDMSPEELWEHEVRRREQERAQRGY